jgi:hypothetical protein
VAPGAGKTDPGDDGAVRIGIQLAQRVPPGELSSQDLYAAVRSHLDDLPGKVAPR